MALLVKCSCGETIAIERPAPGEVPAVTCAACGADVPVPGAGDAFAETGRVRMEAVETGARARGAGAGAPGAGGDDQLSDTHKIRGGGLGREADPAGGGAVAAQERLEPGRCPLCGLRNRQEDVLCEGCGTSLATGEPPPVERFRPRRFDSRIAIAGAIALAVAGLAWGAIGLVRSGADRRAVERGALLAQRQDWRGAAAAFREATLLNPAGARAWALLADARIRLGAQVEEYAEAAERAVRLVSDDAAAEPADAAIARFALGRARLAQGRTEEAERLIERASKDRADLPGLRHFLGHVRFILRRDPAESAVAYEQALALDPRSPEAALSRLRLGLLYLDRGKLTDAEAALRQALAEGAPEAEAKAALGDLHARKGDTPGALAAYRESVAADPRRTWTWFKIARLEDSAGRPDPALEAAQTAVEIEPGEAEFVKLLGRLLEKKGEAQRAAAAYREAARIAPDDPEAPLLMARFEAARGDRARAREAAEAALARDPRYVPALALLGGLAIEAQEWRAAVEAYEKALAVDDGKADLWFSLGLAYEGLSRAGDALNAFRRATSLDRANLAAWERIAAAHLAAGRGAEAGAALAEIVRMRPDDPAPRIRLARIHIDAKRFGPAKDLLADVLKKDPGNAEAKQLLDKVTYLEFQEQPQ